MNATQPNYTQTVSYLDNGISMLPIPAGSEQRVLPRAGGQYRLLQDGYRDTAAMVDSVVVVRAGNDLVLYYPDSIQVVIQDYFTVCDGGLCQVYLPSKRDRKGQKLVVKDGLESDHVVDEATLLALRGEPAQIDEIVINHGALASAVSQSNLTDQSGVDREPIGWLYWVLGVFGAAVGFGIYESSHADDAALLPVFEEPTATASVEENSPLDTVVYDAQARLLGRLADTDILYSIEGTDAESFAIDSASGEVTLNAYADFESQSTYAIDVIAEIPSGATASQRLEIAVTDTEAIQAGNNLDGVANLDVRSNLVLSFDEDVTAVAGRIITIVDASSRGWLGDVTTNTMVIDVDSDQVTIEGGLVIIDPSYDLDFGSDYYLQVEIGAFEGVSSGLASASIEGEAISFRTVAPAATGASSQKMLDDGTLDGSLSWVDTANQGSSDETSVDFAFDAQASDFAFVASLLVDDSGEEVGYDANMLIANFAADTEDSEDLALGDILYYDNQGLDNEAFYDRVEKPASIDTDDGNTVFQIGPGSGEETTNTLTLVGLSLSADTAAGWQAISDYEDSPVILG